MPHFLFSSRAANASVLGKHWKKEQVWPFFGYCTADSQTDAQLYNNGSLVLFSTACSSGKTDPDFVWEGEERGELAVEIGSRLGESFD